MRSAEQSGVGEGGVGVREGGQSDPRVANVAAWLFAELFAVAQVGAGRGHRGQGEMAALLAQMSHEIRTPLNHIIGFAELMGAETYGPLGDPRYAEYVEHIRCSGEQLLAAFAAALSELERAHELPAGRPAGSGQLPASATGAEPRVRPSERGLWTGSGRG